MGASRRNFVQVGGNGDRAIMFAHGYGCDQNMWRYVTPAFSDQYRIVLFDHVGCGNSDPAAFSKSRYSSLHGYSRDVLEIIQELGLEKVTFAGHSVSSMIGALAAIERPELFENLVMIGPSPCYINDGEYLGGFERADIDGLLEALENNHLGWSASMAPLIMGNTERPELSAELEASFCRTNPAFAQHFARVTFLSDNRADLSRIETPTLILQCRSDAIAPAAVGEYCRKNIPNSQFVLLDATGHCPQMSAPQKVIEAMRTFL
jgi:sigma-B regulation protein RsbQ